MSRFYAECAGDRGAATRQGHWRISSHTRGWNGGVEVEGRHARGNEEANEWEVNLTGGSHQPNLTRPIAKIQEDNGIFKVSVYNPETGGLLKLTEFVLAPKRRRNHERDTI